jgi:hypothetical protein
VWWSRVVVVVVVKVVNAECDEEKSVNGATSVL